MGAFLILFTLRDSLLYWGSREWHVFFGVDTVFADLIDVAQTLLYLIVADVTFSGYIHYAFHGESPWILVGVPAGE